MTITVLLRDGRAVTFHTDRSAANAVTDLIHTAITRDSLNVIIGDLDVYTSQIASIEVSDL